MLTIFAQRKNMQRLLLTSALFLAFVLPSSAYAQAQKIGSINVSHPLVFSVGYGNLNGSQISEIEVGLGGAKIGLGLGDYRPARSGAAGTAFAIKAVYMYKWESPIDESIDDYYDIDYVADNPFQDNESYYGAEAVISILPSRFAITAYKNPNKDLVDKDWVIGFSIGVGF